MRLYNLTLDINKEVRIVPNLFTSLDNARGFSVNCSDDIDILELWIKQNERTYKVVGTKLNTV